MRAFVPMRSSPVRLILPRTVPSIRIGSEPVTVPSIVTFGPKNVPLCAVCGSALRLLRRSDLSSKKAPWAAKHSRAGTAGSAGCPRLRRNRIKHSKLVNSKVTNRLRLAARRSRRERCITLRALVQRPRNRVVRSAEGVFSVRRFAVILTIAALASCKGRGSKNEQYRTEKVDRGTITMTVTATGTLVGRHDRPGRQPGLGHHRPALRRLQQPGDARASSWPSSTRRRFSSRWSSARPTSPSRRSKPPTRASTTTARSGWSKAGLLAAVRSRLRASAAYEGARRAGPAVDGRAEAGADEPELHEDRLAHRRHRRRPPVRRRPDRRRVVLGADAVLHRPGPDQDAGAGRRRSVRHRPHRRRRSRRASPSTPIPIRSSAAASRRSASTPR